MSTIKQAILAEKSKGATIRFELRADKADKHGMAPIRLIYQIKGQRKYLNTPLSILPQCWDIPNQQAIYLTKQEAKAKYPAKDFPKLDHVFLFTESQCNEFNQELLSIIREIKAVTDRLKLDGITYSADMVVSKVKENRTDPTKKTDTSNFLFDFIDQYIADHKATREPGSLTVYRTMSKHLADFQKHSGKRVTFENINYGFLQGFQNFLIGKTKIVGGQVVPVMNNITVRKQVQTLKTFLSYAKAGGINVSDDYKKFKITSESLEVIALTWEEFETLYSLDLTDNKRLSQVRDILCFSSTTSFRYSDMNQLRWEHIKSDEIKLRIIKTNELLTVPLNTYSKAILNKYKGCIHPLPMISNQKFNLYVKELCKLAGINEPIEIVRNYGIRREAIVYPKHELISCHTGRKSFATLSLEKGISAEEVMRIGGWRTYASFARYVNITEKRSKVVMTKAWGAATESKLKAV